MIPLKIIQRVKGGGMLKRSGLALVGFLILFITSNASAHHPTGGAGLGKTGPLRTISASPLEPGMWALALQTEYIDLDAYSDDELMDIAESGSDVHSIDSIHHTIFSMGYGLTSDLTVSLKVPYDVLNNIRESHSDEPDEVHVHGDSEGIGDLTVFGQYRFMKLKDPDVESSLVLGLRMPTGRQSERDIEDERFEAEFQPGSGAWVPIAGIAATKRFKALSVDADVLYTFSTEGAQDTDLGDLFNYDLAVSYTALNKPVVLDLIIEANGEWKEKQEIDGDKDENSGGTVIYLSPGMRLSWGKNWSAYLSAGFPVHQDLNGDQNETDMRYLFGLSLSL